MATTPTKPAPAMRKPAWPGNPEMFGGVPDYQVFGTDSAMQQPQAPMGAMEALAQMNQMQNVMGRHVLNPRLTVGGQIEDQTQPQGLDWLKQHDQTGGRSWDVNKTQVNPDWIDAFQMKHPEHVKGQPGLVNAGVDPRYGTGSVSFLQGNQKPQPSMIEGKPASEWFALNGPSAGNPTLRKALGNLGTEGQALFAKDTGYQMPQGVEEWKGVMPPAQQLAANKTDLEATRGRVAAQQPKPFDFGMIRQGAQAAQNVTGMPFGDAVNDNAQKIAQGMDQFLPDTMRPNPGVSPQTMSEWRTAKRSEIEQDVSRHNPSESEARANAIRDVIGDVFRNAPQDLNESYLGDAKRWVQPRVEQTYQQGQENGRGFLGEAGAQVTNKFNSFNEQTTPQIQHLLRSIFGQPTQGEDQQMTPSQPFRFFDAPQLPAQPLPPTGKPPIAYRPPWDERPIGKRATQGSQRAGGRQMF